MSENVIRTGRDLAYQGTVLQVYKDHMKFSNGNTEAVFYTHLGCMEKRMNACWKVFGISIRI